MNTKSDYLTMLKRIIDYTSEIREEIAILEIVQDYEPDEASKSMAINCVLRSAHAAQDKIDNVFS